MKFPHLRYKRDKRKRNFSYNITVHIPQFHIYILKAYCANKIIIVD